VRARAFLPAVLLLAVGVGLTPASGLAAQTVVPGAPPVAPSGPDLGTPVGVVAGDTTPIGTITVVALEDPFAGFAEWWPLPPDRRFVLAEITYENTTAVPQTIANDTFWVVDAQGFTHPQSFPPRNDAELANRPDFLGVAGSTERTVDPGTAVSGAIVFDLAPATAIAQIVSRPTLDYVLTDLSVTLLDLRPTRPGYAESVAIAGPDGAPLAAVVAFPPVDPLLDIGPFVTPEPGVRYVALTVSVTNTGTQPLPPESSDFRLIDRHGIAYRNLTLPTSEEYRAAAPDLRGADLAPGETRTGEVGFRLAADAEIAAVVYTPPGGPLESRFVVVAEPGVVPNAVPAPTSNPVAPDPAVAAVTPDPVADTPGCEGVLAWGEALAPRAFAPIVAYTEVLTQIGNPGGDPGALDPARLRQAAAELRAVADDLADDDVPAIARAANDAVVGSLHQQAETFDALAAAIDAGDRVAIDAAAATAAGLFDTFGEGDAYNALGAACPEVGG